MKVAIQVVLMTTEVGIVEEKEEIIAMGGTGTIELPRGVGCDVAIVMEAVKGERARGRKVKEILCRLR